MAFISKLYKVYRRSIVQYFCKTSTPLSILPGAYPEHRGTCLERIGSLESQGMTLEVALDPGKELVAKMCKARAAILPVKSGQFEFVSA